MNTEGDLQSLYTPSEIGGLDRAALFEQNLEWASVIARNVHRKVPSSFDIDDLTQEAQIALWKKCQLFDETSGVPFQGYAYLYVRGAVLMFCRRRSWTEATHEGLERNFAPSKDGEHGGEGGRMGHAMPLGSRDVDPGPLADARIEGEQTEQFQHARLVRFFSDVPPPIPEAILLLRTVALEGVDLDELARERSISSKELARVLYKGVRQLRKLHPSPVLERFNIPVARRIRSRAFENGVPAHFAAAALSLTSAVATQEC